MKKSNNDEVVKKFNHKFLAPDYKKHFQSFSDLIWQIMMNQIYHGEKVCFWVDVMNEKNQLIIADYKGGYIETDIRFIDDNYNNCVEAVAELNQMVFNLTPEETEKLVNVSMLHNDTLT